MDPRVLLKNLRLLIFDKKKLIIFLIILSSIMILTWITKKFHHSPSPLFKALFQNISLSQFLHTYGKALVSIQEKVDHLKKSQQENERYLLENSNLRHQIEAIRFDCEVSNAAKLTHEMELQLTEETGSRVGQTLASIAYRPPRHLLPVQLYTLGVSYFKAREDEKAAVIFTFLTGLEENNTYKTQKNYLATGITWYWLDHFELADFYFDKVLKSQETNETIQSIAQARLWKALIVERLGKHTKSQYWLREVVDYHPHSTEAAWVNSREIERAPALDE